MRHSARMPLRRHPELHNVFFGGQLPRSWEFPLAGPSGGVVLRQFLATPSGFSFEAVVATRPKLRERNQSMLDYAGFTDEQRDPFGLLGRFTFPGGLDAQGTVPFADLGRWASRSAGPVQLLRGRASGGGGGSVGAVVTHEFSAEGLPPAGPMTLTISWLSRGIPAQTFTMDAGDLLEAAASARPLAQAPTAGLRRGPVETALERAQPVREGAGTTPAQLQYALRALADAPLEPVSPGAAAARRRSAAPVRRAVPHVAGSRRG